MVVDSYDNEEDCKDDYVETEQQVMNVGGLCIYAASRLPCAAVTVCACNYPPELQYITVWGVQLRKPLHTMGIIGRHLQQLKN